MAAIPQPWSLRRRNPISSTRTSKSVRTSRRAAAWRVRTRIFAAHKLQWLRQKKSLLVERRLLHEALVNTQEITRRLVTNVRRRQRINFDMRCRRAVRLRTRRTSHENERLRATLTELRKQIAAAINEKHRPDRENKVQRRRLIDTQTLIVGNVQLVAALRVSLMELIKAGENLRTGLDERPVRDPLLQMAMERNFTHFHAECVNMKTWWSDDNAIMNWQCLHMSGLVPSILVLTHVLDAVHRVTAPHTINYVSKARNFNTLLQQWEQQRLH